MKRGREEEGDNEPSPYYRDNEPSPYYRQDERVTLVVSEREPKDLRDSVPASRMVAIAPTDIPLDVKTVFVNKIWLHMTLKDIISLARTSRAFYLIMRQTRPYQMMLWMRDKYLDLNLEIGRAMRHAAKRNLFQGGYHCLQYLCSKIRVGLGVLVDPVYYAARCGQLENVILILGFAFGLVGKREFSVGALLSMPPSRSLLLETIGFEKDATPFHLGPVAGHILPTTAYIPKKLSKKLVEAVLKGSILTFNDRVFSWCVAIILDERRDSGWDSSRKRDRASLKFHNIVTSGLSVGNEKMALEISRFTVPGSLNMEPMSDTIRNSQGPVSRKIVLWAYRCAIIDVAASCEPGMSLKKKEELIDRYLAVYHAHSQKSGRGREVGDYDPEKGPFFGEAEICELYSSGADPVLFKRFLLEALRPGFEHYGRPNINMHPALFSGLTAADLFRFEIGYQDGHDFYFNTTDLCFRIQEEEIKQIYPITEGTFMSRSRDELQKFKNRYGCMKVLRTLFLSVNEKKRRYSKWSNILMDEIPGSVEYLRKLDEYASRYPDHRLEQSKYVNVPNPANPNYHQLHKELTESARVSRDSSRHISSNSAIAPLFFETNPEDKNMVDRPRPVLAPKTGPYFIYPTDPDPEDYE